MNFAALRSRGSARERSYPVAGYNRGYQLPVTQPWRQNPDIQPIVVPAYENIGWDEQGEVIPGISLG